MRPALFLELIWWWRGDRERASHGHFFHHTTANAYYSASDRPVAAIYVREHWHVLFAFALCCKACADVESTFWKQTAQQSDIKYELLIRVKCWRNQNHRESPLCIASFFFWWRAYCFIINSGYCLKPIFFPGAGGYIFYFDDAATFFCVSSACCIIVIFWCFHILAIYIKKWYSFIAITQFENVSYVLCKFHVSLNTEERASDAKLRCWGWMMTDGLHNEESGALLFLVLHVPSPVVSTPFMPGVHVIVQIKT